MTVHQPDTPDVPSPAEVGPSPALSTPLHQGSAASAAVDPVEPVAKIVKRYSNRKLYDTARSKYVTLDEIARMVRAGEDVRIIDNESKEDLTSVTLTQILYEQEKTSKRMPLEMLRGMIQTSGETLNDLLDRSVATAQKSMEKSVGTVTEFRQTALSSLSEVATKQLNDLTESARRFFSREERRAEEFRRTTGLLVDQLEARLTDRAQQVKATRAALVQHAALQDEEDRPVETVLEQNTHNQAHVAELRRRVTALSVMVDRLEAASHEPVPEDDEV